MVNCAAYVAHLVSSAFALYWHCQRSRRHWLHTPFACFPGSTWLNRGRHLSASAAATTPQFSPRSTIQTSYTRAAPKLWLCLVLWPSLAPVLAFLYRRAVRPNPSVNRSTNGGPPGPAWRYTVHFRQSGPGVPPLAPGYLER